METDRSVHFITETDDLRDCLNNARVIWPEHANDETYLLQRILDEGISAINKKVKLAQSSRKSSMDSLVKTFSGIYPQDWASTVKNEWPDS